LNWKPRLGKKVATLRKLSFRNVLTDKDHRFGTAQQTTSVTLGAPVDRTAFAPTLLSTDRAHVVPLVERAGHVGVTVRIANRDWFFLLDTGAQAILVDGSVLKAAGVDGQGALEARGAARTGGLRLARLSQIAIHEPRPALKVEFWTGSRDRPLHGLLRRRARRSRLT